MIRELSGINNLPLSISTISKGVVISALFGKLFALLGGASSQQSQSAGVESEFLAMPFGSRFIGLGFSSDTSLSNGACLGSLSSTTCKLSGFWGAVCLNFRGIFPFLSAEFMLSMAVFGLWNDSLGDSHPSKEVLKAISACSGKASSIISSKGDLHSEISSTCEAMPFPPNVNLKGYPC